MKMERHIVIFVIYLLQRLVSETSHENGKACHDICYVCYIIYDICYRLISKTSHDNEKEYRDIWLNICYVICVTKASLRNFS